MREFAESGGIALFISHRLEEIELLSDRVTVLRGGVDVGSGPISEMSEARLVELMLGRPVERVFPEATTEPRSDEVICDVTHLASPPRLRDVSLAIRRGEIVGVGGLQGQGQLPLFLALFGAIRVERKGRRSRAGRCGCATPGPRSTPASRSSPRIGRPRVSA